MEGAWNRKQPTSESLRDSRDWDGAGVTLFTDKENAQPGAEIDWIKSLGALGIFSMEYFRAFRHTRKGFYALGKPQP